MSASGTGAAVAAPLWRLPRVNPEHEPTPGILLGRRLRRLLIACDPRRSPDRGTLTLLAELSRCATATRVWLLPAPLGGKLDPVRLDDWRQALDALRLAHCTGDLEELAWLETNP